MLVGQEILPIIGAGGSLAFGFDSDILCLANNGMAICSIIIQGMMILLRQ